MPIRIPDELPAKEVLLREGINVMGQHRADHQDIRPLRVAILNLMPKKEETERQLLRLLGNSPLQVTVTFLQLRSHQAKNTSALHLEKFYQYFDAVRESFFDCLIITGAPVEQLAFEQVDYWEELCAVFDWSTTHVFSTLHICWAAQARLHYDFGIAKIAEAQKIFGVYEHRTETVVHPLTRGFDDWFLAPHSRHTGIDEAQLAQESRVQVLAHAPDVGTLMAATADLRRIFITGHLEYDADTLHQEYERDRFKRTDVPLPCGYYPQNDPQRAPRQTWRATAHLFYHNWLNSVYQNTPYRLHELLTP